MYDIEILADMDAAARNWFKLSNYPGITLRADLNSVISFAWREVGKPEVRSICAWDNPESWNRNINDDKWICEKIAEVLKGADAFVTHNGKRFDHKFLATRFLIQDIKPGIPDVPHIDTCALLKKHTFLSSNSLANAARVLTEEEKMDSGGADLWYAVRQRDPQAQELIRKYNEQDVVAMSAVFTELRPFAKNLPNYNLFYDGEQQVCPLCGSTRLIKFGFRFSKTKKFQRYLCHDCGGESRTNMKDALPRA